MNSFKNSYCEKRNSSWYSKQANKQNWRNFYTMLCAGLILLFRELLSWVKTGLFHCDYCNVQTVEVITQLYFGVGCFVRYPSAATAQHSVIFSRPLWVPPGKEKLSISTPQRQNTTHLWSIWFLVTRVFWAKVKSEGKAASKRFIRV